MTPPKHVNFRAKKLCGAVGNIVDASVAYIDLNGGGPTEPHTHEHNHLFIVTEGEAPIKISTSPMLLYISAIAATSHFSKVPKNGLPLSMTTQSY